MSGTRSARNGHEPDQGNDLLVSIRDKCDELDCFLHEAVSHRRRLLNITIIAGASSASLTAAPAFGGKSFTNWLNTTLGLTAPAWQLLCTLAAACSLAATVSTQLLRSHNVDEHITRAQEARAKMEGLQVGIATRQLTRASAASEYMNCIEGVAFIDPSAGRSRRRRRTPGRAESTAR